MAAVIEIDLQDATHGTWSLPDATQLQRWAARAYQGEDDTEMTIRIVDASESSGLNSQYRGKDYPTNVLSFPFEAPAGITVPLLGDLVICASVVEAEARQQDKPLEAHWAHMVVHGTLHLQGYDHEQDADAEVMEALEIRLLTELGYANPYASETKPQRTRISIHERRSFESQPEQ